MLNPFIIDYLIATHTADSLRDLLREYEFAPINRAYIIAAIYYLEGTDNA